MISQSSTAASAPSSLSSTPVGDADAHRQLLHTLFIELFQTEQSADVHSRREADRLGETPPAVALRAVADHAKASLVEITELAKRRGFSDTRGGKVVGSLFSNVRDLLVDRLVDRERSYRGTLLGMRHGLDLVRSTAFAAEAAGDTTLAIALTTWLLVRGRSSTRSPSSSRGSPGTPSGRWRVARDPWARASRARSISPEGDPTPAARERAAAPLFSGDATGRNGAR